MTRRIRKATSRPEAGSQSSSPRTGGALRPNQIIAGSQRLAILALSAACAIVITAVFHQLVSPLPPRSPGAPLWRLGVMGGLGLSLLMAAIAGRGKLSTEKLLDLGLVYEVLQALFAGLTFYSISFWGIAQWGGSSPVALWVLAYTLIVPNTRGKTFVAAVTSALMDPFALAIAVAAGVPPPGMMVAALIVLPTVICTTIAIVVSRQMYELAEEAAHGRDVGSYHLEELLGSGGMGEVWRASHRMLARPAAIKLIRFDRIFNWRVLTRRFQREARATAALQSPHTVDVYDYGTTEDGSFYYVMELLEGFDLETLVERFGPLPPERAVYLLRQACHSLAEAHARGLIHRDIKPENIFVCRYGIDLDFVKVLDFGLVKNPVTDPAGSLTGARFIAGTPAYMSPERALGSADVDWRSDIYSLGCVVYWLVTGHRVFEGLSSTGVISAHIATRPTPPGRLVDTRLPPELEAIIMSCLEKDPEKRPQSALALADALNSVALPAVWSESRARAWWLQNGPRPPSRRFTSTQRLQSLRVGAPALPAKQQA